MVPEDVRQEHKQKGRKAQRSYTLKVSRSNCVSGLGRPCHTSSGSPLDPPVGLHGPVTGSRFGGNLADWSQSPATHQLSSPAYGPDSKLYTADLLWLLKCCCAQSTATENNLPQTCTGTLGALLALHILNPTVDVQHQMASCSTVTQSPTKPDMLCSSSPQLHVVHGLEKQI